MNKKYKSLLIFIFSIIYPFLSVFLVYLIPENILELIPNNLILLVIDIVFVSILYLSYKEDLKLEWDIFINDWKKILGDNVKYWIIGLIVMSILNILITALISKDIPENEKLVRELLKNMPIYMMISTVIIAPFTEEIIYRKTIKDLIHNRYFYFIMCGLLFGLAHVIYSYKEITDFLFILPYGALGVAFAYMYDKSKTIFTPIAFHSIHNLIMIVMALIMSMVG